MTLLSIYGSTAFGRINGNSAVYATAVATSAALSTALLGVGQTFATTYQVFRGFLEFDTSALPLGQQIVRVRLWLTVTTDSSTTDFDVQVRQFGWASPINAGNREANYDGGIAGSLDVVAFNTNGISLNTPIESPNLSTSYISRTGYTRYCLTTAREGTTPGGAETLVLANINNGTVAYRPRLDFQLVSAAGEIGAPSVVQR